MVTASSSPACTAAAPKAPEQPLRETDTDPQQKQQQQQAGLQQQQQQATLQEQQQTGVTRRIAVLECEDSERWKGYTESLWKAALWQEGDDWTIYQACSGQLPSPAEAAHFDAILVSGSHYSVYEDYDWIKQLLQALPQYVATGVRIYGCCFGSQVLAQALGGSVGPNPDGNFVLTIEQVTPTEHVQQYKQLGSVLQAALKASTDVSSPPLDAPQADREAAAAAAAEAVPGAVAEDSSTSSSSRNGHFSNKSSDRSSASGADQLSGLSLSSSNGSNGGSSAACGSGGCFQLIESHGDQVLKLPPGAVVLASSPTAPYELWCYGNNVLASQFHLEFDELLVIDKIWTRLADIGRLDSEQSVQSRKALEAGGQHNVQMLQVIKHFLQHGIR